MKKILLLLSLVGALVGFNAQAALEITVEPVHHDYEWKTVVYEQTADWQGSLWDLKWEMIYSRTAVKTSQGWVYNTTTEVHLDQKPIGTTNYINSYNETITDDSAFSFSDDDFHFEGLWVPNMGPLGGGYPDVNSHHAELWVDSLTWVFYCPWDDVNGQVDRVYYGDWFLSSQQISGSIKQETKHVVRVHDWDNRDPALGNKIKVTWDGVEYDKIWLSMLCKNSYYSMTETITPTGDGTYSISAQAPDQDYDCGAWTRPDTSPDRDHLLTHLTAVQSH